jgi:hypothetical protein
MGLPESVVGYLRQKAEEGRREAPPGLEEHFARRRATAAYLGIMEVAGDLSRMGLRTILDDPETEVEEGQPTEQIPELGIDSERATADLATKGLTAAQRGIAPWRMTEEENRNPDGTYKFFGD